MWRGPGIGAGVRTAVVSNADRLADPATLGELERKHLRLRVVSADEGVLVRRLVGSERRRRQ